MSADYNVLAHVQAPVDLKRFDVEEPETLEGWQVTFLGGATKQDFLEAKVIDADPGHQNYSILVENLEPIPPPDQFENAE